RPEALLISLERIDRVGRSDTNDENSQRHKHAEQNLLFHFTPRRELTALREFGGWLSRKQAAAGQTFGYEALHRQALSGSQRYPVPGSASDASLAQMGQIYSVRRTGGKHSFTGSDRDLDPVLPRPQRAAPGRVVRAVWVVRVVEVDDNIVAVRVQFEIAAGAVGLVPCSQVAKWQEAPV